MSPIPSARFPHYIPLELITVTSLNNTLYYCVYPDVIPITSAHSNQYFISKHRMDSLRQGPSLEASSRSAGRKNLRLLWYAWIPFRKASLWSLSGPDLESTSLTFKVNFNIILPALLGHPKRLCVFHVSSCLSHPFYHACFHNNVWWNKYPEDPHYTQSSHPPATPPVLHSNITLSSLS